MDFFKDLTGYVVNPVDTTPEIKHSSNKKAGQDLDMSDYMQLMIASFQNQSIDDVASTSDMMNQMAQMTVVQAIQNLNKIVSDSNSMAYVASLVGKDVTIGIQDGKNLSTLVGNVAGTGMLGGELVLYLTDGDMYKLSDVIAVGKIPANVRTVEADENGKDFLGLSANAYTDYDALYEATQKQKDNDASYSGKNYDYVDAGDGSMRIVYREDAENAVSNATSAASEAEPLNSTQIPTEAYEAAAEELREML